MEFVLMHRKKHLNYTVNNLWSGYLHSTDCSIKGKQISQALPRSSYFTFHENSNKIKSLESETCDLCVQSTCPLPEM